MEFKQGDYITVCNSQQLKIRIDKLVANILHISRSKVKSLEKDGTIEIVYNYFEGMIEILIKGEFIGI